jgi:hypothetical protein
MANRFDYVKYDSEAQELQDIFKGKFRDLEISVNLLKPGRATSLVFTKLEEAYMWVGKAIRDEQIVRNANTELNESRG